MAISHIPSHFIRRFRDIHYIGTITELGESNSSRTIHILPSAGGTDTLAEMPCHVRPSPSPVSQWTL